MKLKDISTRKPREILKKLGVLSLSNYSGEKTSVFFVKRFNHAIRQRVSWLCRNLVAEAMATVKRMKMELKK